MTNAPERQLMNLLLFTRKERDDFFIPAMGVPMLFCKGKIFFLKLFKKNLVVKEI